METGSEQGFQKRGSVLLGGYVSQSARLCHSQNQLCGQWGLFFFWESRRSDPCLEAGGWDPLQTLLCYLALGRECQLRFPQEPQESPVYRRGVEKEGVMGIRHIWC